LFFNAGKGLEEQVSPTIETTLPKPVKNKSILLVEDNPVSAKVIIKILQNAGYKTHQAWNGKEALIILDEENFDLILMDGEMPIMNGYETTAAIREGKSFAKFKEYKTIPIVALMASSNEKTIKRAMDSGMNYYLEKSAYKAKLLELIERLCSESC
jgi:CheY-like chemotaxis protein